MSQVVEVDNVWKSFPIVRDRPGFKEFVLRLPGLRGQNPAGSFWALKGVSFSVQSGECLGIIGKNGAGKSTLLSLILGTVHPTQGKLKVAHRVTPLLELGAGFHPDLTGTENIFINGLILGLTRREVEARLGEIVAFAGIGEFINMPLRTYSSGMYLRLAFSVAIHTDPKLLLIDEVLSVGDEAFQRKSSKAMVELIKGGVTTILVSHNLAAVQELCDRAIWLDDGKVKAAGAPEAVIKEYVSHAV